MKNWIVILMLALTACTSHKPPRKIQRLYAARCVVDRKVAIESIYTLHLRVLKSTFPTEGILFQEGMEFSLPVDEDTWNYLVKGNGVFLLYALYNDYTYSIFQGDPYIVKKNGESYQQRDSDGAEN